VTNLGKNGSGAQASQATCKPCARCGAAIEGNEICPQSQDFFRELSDREVIFTANICRMQRRWSVVGGK
jgi:hypothetical protein